MEVLFPARSISAPPRAQGKGMQAGLSPCLLFKSVSKAPSPIPVLHPGGGQRIGAASLPLVWGWPQRGPWSSFQLHVLEAGYEWGPALQAPRKWDMARSSGPGAWAGA